MATAGKVEKFDPDKGFGFILVGDDKDKKLFFHLQDCGGFSPVEGCEVTFQPDKHEEGKNPQVKNVVVTKWPKGTPRYYGIVQSFSFKSGYGFVSCEAFPGKDVFLNQKDCGWQTPVKESKCNFNVEETEKGPNAKKVYFFGKVSDRQWEQDMMEEMAWSQMMMMPMMMPMMDPTGMGMGGMNPMMMAGMGGMGMGMDGMGGMGGKGGMKGMSGMGGMGGMGGKGEMGGMEKMKEMMEKMKSMMTMWNMMKATKGGGKGDGKMGGAFMGSGMMGGGPSMGDSSPAVHAFIMQNGLDDKCAQALVQAPPHVQQMIMNDGDFSNARNPSAACFAKINKALTSSFSPY